MVGKYKMGLFIYTCERKIKYRASSITETHSFNFLQVLVIESAKVMVESMDFRCHNSSEDPPDPTRAQICLGFGKQYAAILWPHKTRANEPIDTKGHLQKGRRSEIYL